MLGDHTRAFDGDRHTIRVQLLSSVFVDRGVERIMLWLQQRLPPDRYQVRIASLRSLAPFADRLKASGQDSIDVIGMRHQLDVPALFRLYRYLRRVQPDVLHIHSLRAAIWGRPIARLARVPVILYSVHNKWGGAAHHALDRWSSACGDAVIPFSLAVRRYLLDEVGLDPARVAAPVYIGIDLDRFQPLPPAQLAPARQALGIAPGDRVLGFVGALFEQKGLAYLIEVLATLRLDPAHRHLKCLLIGQGPLEPRLRSQADRLGLRDAVLFLGQRDDVPLLLQLMDVFVLPSLWEGLPQVVLEALASGAPVVATAVDGTPEIITHGVDGWLVPPGDVAALGESLRLLLSDGALRSRLAHNGRCTAATRFSVQRMVENFDCLYQQYLAKARRNGR